MHAWSGVVQGIAPAVARRGMEAGSMGASAPGVWRVSPRGGRVAGRAAASRRRGLHMMAERVKTMVVVGGGPAGFMAAIQAARAAEDAGCRKQLHVVVLEATSKVLGKVKISGGGRCNVLHDESKGARVIADGYPRGRKEILGALARFGPTETADWFRREGVTLKTEPDGRMFPITDDSQTIIDALEGAAARAGVEVRTLTRVDLLGLAPGFKSDDATGTAKGHKFTVSCSGRGEHSKVTLACDIVVLSPGSSRLAWQWAAGLGHRLEAPVPSLFTFKINHPLLNGLAGLSVQAAEVSIVPPAGKSKKLKEGGPVLVTHQGISGPAVLRLSAFGARQLHDLDYQFTARVNWRPDVAGGVEGIMQEFDALKKFQGSKAIGGSNGPTLDLPRRLWQALLAQIPIAPDQKWCDTKKSDLRKLALLITQCDFEVAGKNTNKDEFVTAGGISLPTVDMSKMSSKSVPGLFFCGEVLDIDGITGGYNLQSAWTTGTIAGRSIAQLLRPGSVSI